MLNTLHPYKFIMLTREEIVDKLSDRNLSEVSRRTDIPIATIWRFINIEDYNTSYVTVKKLSDYLERAEA